MSPDLSALRAAFAGPLFTTAEDIAPFVTDWRKSWTGTALAVALPESTADVAAVVRWCAANDVCIVPQGGNTGQSGGSVPRATGQNLVLSLNRVNRVRAIDPANNTIAVDAGCVLQTVQEAADAADRLFPLSLGAEGSCTIGGNLATNAGGTAVLRYGSARALCLGLEVVTASGAVWNGMRGLRKDNSGYDLRDLFIGSEGTLGIITGAVLTLFPKPAARLVAWAGVASVEQAMALFAAVRAAHHDALTAFEIVSDIALAMVLTQVPDMRAPLGGLHRWHVLIEFTDLMSEAGARAALEAALAGGLEAGLIGDAVIAGSMAQSRALWQLRERISEAQGRHGPAMKHDIAVPVSAIAAFVEDAHAAVAARFPGAVPVTFGHLGDGNLHFNYSPGPRDDPAAITAIVHEAVRRNGGTISAEHGLGQLRHDEADMHRGATERALMRTIKSALDPQGILNPGKVLP